jgi:hypothetical protein
LLLLWRGRSCDGGCLHVAKVLLRQSHGFLVRNTGESNNSPLGLEECVPVCLHSLAVDLIESLLGTQKRVTKSVVLVSGHVHQFRQNQLRLAPNLSNLIISRLKLPVHFLIRNLRIANRLRQHTDRIRHGRVESRRLVHQALARRSALDVSTELIDRLQHLVRAPFGRRLERKPVDDV